MVKLRRISHKKQKKVSCIHILFLMTYLILIIKVMKRYLKTNLNSEKKRK